MTSGEKGDGQFLEALVNQSRENGVTVESFTGDTAYSGKENLKLAKRDHFQLYSKLHPIISNGSRTPSQTWDFNKDAGMFVCPADFMATRVARSGKKIKVTIKATSTTLTQITVRYVRNSRGVIDQAPRQKTYSVTIKSKEHQDQMAFQAT